MKNLSLLQYKILISIFLFVSITYTQTTYAVGANELEQSKENFNIISSIFSTALLLNFIFALITIVGTFVISKMVSAKISSYMENSSGNGEGSNREELAGVITRTANITILAIGFSITLSILGIDMGIFLAGLGFGIGFTLKIFLSNFISGIIMVTQGTYHNGDIIEIGGKVGKIVKIHSLFTAVEQFDGVFYYVPNVRFLEENVSNYYSNDKRRIEIDVGIDYNSDIVLAKKVMLQVIEQFPNILKAPESSIFVDKLDSSCINLSLRFWIDSKDLYFTTKSNVTETINLAFKKSGIVIAFPQMTITNRNDFQIPETNKKI